MNDYPSPPTDSTLTPKQIEIQKGDQLYRFNKSGHTSCLYYSKNKTYRFDDPQDNLKSRYGVWYTALTVDAAFAETYGHDVTTLSNNNHKVLSEQQLNDRRVFKVTLKDTLALADLTGTGLPALNLDGNICSMPDYTRSQQWSRWLHQHSGQYDGIFYHSRHLSGYGCIAAFERAGNKLTQETDLGPAIQFKDPRSGKTIFDILEQQGWAFR